MRDRTRGPTLPLEKVVSMQTRETVETRLTRIAAYVRIYTGTDATPREMARFLAPFGYRLGDDGQPAPVKRGTG